MFGKRFNLFTIAGFKIGIDVSWFFIAALLTWTLAAGYFPLNYPKLSATAYWLMGLSGMLGLFICVILHELGHAIVARHNKLPISQITLFIFGGVAELQKEPTSAKVEFLMAIAGPIVSFILAFLFYLLGKFSSIYHWPVPVKGVATYLALINFLLAAFNLIPAFPLDGGRILRSLLWAWKKNLAWATRICSLIGSGFGFALIFLGIYSLFKGSFLSGFWLIILGLFLHRAASSINTQFHVGKELEGEKVAKFMKKDPIAVSPQITVKEFIENYVYVTHHHLYPVTESGRFLGYVSLKEVKELAIEDRSKTTVKEIMISMPHQQTVSPETSALAALDLIQKSDTTTLFVVSKGYLEGILTAQDLFKIISLKLELEDANYSR